VAKWDGSGRELRTRIVPPLITNDGDGLDAYRVDTYTPPIDLLPHQAVLVMTRGPRCGSYCVVDHEPVEIGRASTALPLNDSTVSRRHALVDRTDGEFWIRDLGSLNGVHVNDRTVERARLHHGDQIQIGLFKLLFLEASSSSP
jgi:pSer/pThr/pTyr-binding forkhead associated (FHA) protein